MILENDKYFIEITVDHTYTIGSADNQRYDTILNPYEFKRSDWLKVFSISVYEVDNPRSIALIGSSFSCENDCAILENDKLIVLMNTALLIIDLDSMRIINQQHISDFGTFFSIYRYADGYIVHGELEVIKLGIGLQIEWAFSGRDIFVLPNSDSAFSIDGDYIKLIDWDGHRYTVDRFGKEV